MVALDGQIDARVVDQVWNQDIFQHIQIVFARVETHQDQFSEVVMHISQHGISFFQ